MKNQKQKERVQPERYYREQDGKRESREERDKEKGKREKEREITKG
jgi:hypothetical protein